MTKTRTPPDPGLPCEDPETGEKGFIPPPARKPATRRCLSCGRLFPSRDTGHRYCARCRGEAGAGAK